MDDLTRILLVGVIVFLTHALEGITGFGCTVLALPFVAMLLGIKTAIPVLAVLAWLLAGYIVLVSRKKIVWNEFGFIVLHVALGLPIGILVFQYLSPVYLKMLLGVFMLGVGIHGLRKTLNRNTNDATVSLVRKSIVMRGVLFLGGIVHGAFATGGPFVVIYASRALPEKSVFRVSLCLLWATMNTVLMIQYTLAGNVWNKEIGASLLAALPFLVVGTLTGDYLHHVVSEHFFRIVVYGMLLASGIILLFDVFGSRLFSTT